MKYRMSEGLTNIGTPLKEAMDRTPRPKEPEQREPTKQEHNILMGALKRSGKVVAQPEQEPLKVLNDQCIFDKLGGIFGDPKHHKIPLTKGQIVEFGRKMFELGTRPCTTPPQHVLMAEYWKNQYEELKAQLKEKNT